MEVILLANRENWHCLFQGQLCMNWKDIQRKHFNKYTEEDNHPAYKMAQWWITGIIQQLIFFSLILGRYGMMIHTKTRCKRHKTNLERSYRTRWPLGTITPGHLADHLINTFVSLSCNRKPT